jgi:hypothetical protein
MNIKESIICMLGVLLLTILLVTLVVAMASGVSIIFQTTCSADAETAGILGVVLSLAVTSLAIKIVTVFFLQP